jgi:hypothetical protein
MLAAGPFCPILSSVSSNTWRKSPDFRIAVARTRILTNSATSKCGSRGTHPHLKIRSYAVGAGLSSFSLGSPMATRFLLPCTCGREIPVDAGQAGDSALCECGRRVLVPKLGQLRLLPRVQSVAAETTWSPRKGLIALCAIIGVVCLVLGIYSWAVTPRIGADDLQAAIGRTGDFIDSLSPVDTWVYWHQRSVPMGRQGLTVDASPQRFAHDAEVELRTTHQRLAFGAAGLAALVSLTLVLWRPSRQAP